MCLSVYMCAYKYTRMCEQINKHHVHMVIMICEFFLVFLITSDNLSSV